MKEEKNKVIFKIKKLLAIADGKANLNEALSAAEVAQRLISLHNITESELNSAQADSSPEPVFDWLLSHREPYTSIVDPPEYLQVLLDVVASANHCAIYVAPVRLDNKEVKVFSIVGQSSKIEVVTFLFYWIFLQIEKLFLESNHDDRRDFYFGVCAKLKQKLSLANENPHKDIPKEILEKALVNLSSVDKEVQDKLNESTGNLDRRTEFAKNKNVFMEGFSAADKIKTSKDKELEKSPERLLLK